MTFIQKLVTTLLPASWSRAIRHESQRWLLRCPSCNTVRSVWEIGGIRFKATSTGKRVRVWCPHCEQARMMPLEYKESGPDDDIGT